MDESFGAESITDVGDPALVQAPSIEIERGAVLAGRYQVEAVIGKGGSGVVLRAFDRVTESLVAIKILRPDLARDPRWVERFSRELRLGRQIQHPNVCRIFDIGEADGHRFLTMELATGGTLRDGIDDKSRTLSERIADARALLSGLAAIHGAGIVHRDVKPENLLRMADGRLVLSDFGLATNPGDAPATTIMVGTPSYMAPEIVTGLPATARSDVWAAGVVMHEILFGARPQRRKPGDRQAAKSSLARRASRLEKALEYVRTRCMDEDPEDRPADAAAVERLLETATVNPVRFAYGAYRFRLPTSARTWGLIAVAVAIATFGVRHRLWRSVAASSAALDVARVVARGQPTDWSESSTVLASLDGRAYCFSLLPGNKVARLVWGSPRRAEDINLDTGARVPATLASATYRIDCPQLSAQGDALLFTRAIGRESPQIMLARIDGSEGKPLIAGSAPLWLPRGDEFVFNLDVSHVAIFSLPTMSFRLLPETDSSASGQVHEKALNARGDRLAIAYSDSEVDRLFVVHALPGFEVLAKWRLSRSASSIAFEGDNLMLSEASDTPALARFDWRAGTMVRVGSVSGASRLSKAVVPNGPPVLLSEKRTTDVWLFDRDHAEGKQITTDGESYSGSRSPSGDVLVQSRVERGRVVIVKYGRDGQVTPVTHGPSDCCASFARDGSTWVYSDYERRMIRSCDAAGCRDLRHEDLLPGWPVISPDGERIAFVTQIGSPRLHLIDKRGGSERDIGPTATECPPVWSAPWTIWSFSGAGSEREWVEIDAKTGRKTGRSKATVNSDSDRLACGWESEASGSPFFQVVRPILRQTTQVRLLREIEAAN